METLQCIESRRSVRKYEDRPVPHDVIEKIVAAAAYAPSWKNTQVSRYTVVEDKDIIKKIADECVLDFEYNQKTIGRCQALTIVSVVKNRSGYEKDGSFTTSKEDRWEMFDAGIAAQTFCLAAHDMGVGTVILGIFDDAKVAEAIDLPEGQQVAAMIAMGYPAFAPEAPARKTVEDLLRYK